MSTTLSIHYGPVAPRSMSGRAVHIDGEYVGNLGLDDARNIFPLDPGVHLLTVHQGWHTSVPLRFTAADGEHVEVIAHAEDPGLWGAVWGGYFSFAKTMAA